MSYRKITVDGNEYMWAAGKTHTKIRLGARGKSTLYLNSEWGTPVIHRDYPTASWDGSDHVLATPGNSVPATYVIASGDVKGMITGERYWKDHACYRHPNETITGLTFDPFDLEINQKRTLVRNCRPCNYDRYMDT